MPRRFLVVAILASTIRAGGQQSAWPAEDAAAIRELTPLCAQEESTDRAETDLLSGPPSPAVTHALQSESAFSALLTDPATPYLDRMMAAKYGGSATNLGELPTLWKAAAQLAAAPVGVYPSPCYFLRSSQYNPRDWLRRRERRLGATVSNPESRVIAGRTVALPVEAVDCPVTPEARANAPWLWQMRRAFEVLMPEVRRYFAEPSRYPAMAEKAWAWQPADHHETRERLDALRAGPRNADWIAIILRLVLNGAGARDADVVRDLYVFGNDSYQFEELVHAAQIVILQQTDRWDVAQNAAYQAGEMATANYRSFSKVLEPIRTAIATIEIARWARNTALKEPDRYGFAAIVCRMVDDPPFKPKQALVNSPRKEYAAEISSALAAFDSWFADARTRLERQAEAERVRWNTVASEFGRRID